MSRTRLLAFTLLAALPASATPARAQPEADASTQPESGGEAVAPEPEVELSDQDRLARGKALYEAGDYADCAAVLEALLGTRGERPLPDREIAEDGRFYYAACLLGSNQPKRADAVFREAIRYNPQAAPNPLDFPQPVVERFEAVRQTMLEEIQREDRERAARARQAARRRQLIEKRERARQQQLRELASQETIVVRNRRWLAAVPFGVGQFQNRSPVLGGIFLFTELAALGATAGGMIYELELEAQYRPSVDEADLNAKLRNARRLWTVSLYSFAGLAVLGIAEAELSFLPEFREVRPRKLPRQLLEPEPRGAAASVALGPLVEPSSGGAGLMIRGRF